MGALDLTNDEQVLAATIYGEARGEPIVGKQAVASVVMNRVALAIATKRKQFGNGSVKSCCLAPWQFSCWNASDPNRPILMGLDFTNPSDQLVICKTIAEEAISGDLRDPTFGATFYKVTSLPWPHDWGAKVAPLAVIGHQSFYHLQ